MQHNDSTVNIISLDTSRDRDPGKSINNGTYGANKYYQFLITFEHERASSEVQDPLYGTCTTNNY